MFNFQKNRKSDDCFYFVMISSVKDPVTVALFLFEKRYEYTRKPYF